MTNEEKDCTDQLTECHVLCEPSDKECVSECVEEYNECIIPENITESPIIGKDTTQYDWEEDEGELISELLQISALLNGTCTRVHTLNSTGRSSKKIIIEYDVKQK